MTPIVAPDTTRHRPRKTRLGGPYDFMRREIASERGGALYSKRMPIVEPVFAQIKANRQIDRLKRRGRAAARSESRLDRRPPQHLEALPQRVGPGRGLRITDPTHRRLREAAGAAWPGRARTCATASA